MEKQTLVGDGQRNGHPARRRRRSFESIGWIGLASLIAFCWYRSNSLLEPPKFRTYDGETVRWQPCGYADELELECGEIEVPMDQFNSTNSGEHTFSIPLIRTRGDNATKNILVNPGGPGGSGLGFIYNRSKQLRTIVGSGFHLVSFDPRGINASRPRVTCYPDEDTRRLRAFVHDANFPVDSPEMYAWSSNYAQACADTMGEHAKYINTPQTAADMNSILDALGQKEMYYWGFSYGTLLGQTYATMFPERSERIIIDGVVEQVNWYETLVEKGDLVDADNVYHGFVDECIKAGANCSLSSMASDKDDLFKTLSALEEELKSDPIVVYINNTVYGMIDYQTLHRNAIFPALYKPLKWPDLADRLFEILNGNATQAFLSYAMEIPFAAILEANFMVHFNDAKSGSKYWPQKRTDVLDMLLPVQNISSFLPLENTGYFIKQQWKVPRTHTYVPQKGVKTAHPILIMSMTTDPVTPLSYARLAREAFDQSRLVELKGYGHCTLALPSSCTAKHIREFLYKGKMPAEDVLCEPDVSYFQSPEQVAIQIEEASSHESEDQRIKAAQLALAQGMEWQPRWT